MTPCQRGQESYAAVVNINNLTPDERRHHAATLASDIHTPDGTILVPLGPTETRALADLLDMLTARPAADPLGAESILNDTATTMAARLREHAEQTQHAPAR